MKRGITTVEALRARCIVDPATHCWLWQGAVSGGQPKFHTFCHQRGCKVTMTGQRGAWNIAHGEAPPHWALVFRACQRTLCVNPAHLRLARDQADIGRHIHLSGTRLGTATDLQRMNGRKGRERMGIKDTPADVVRQIREAPASVKGIELAALHKLSNQTVSKIRRGLSRVAA